MKKWLSLILAVVMLMTVAPVFAEDGAEGEGDSSGLSDLLNGLMSDGGEGEGDSSGLGDLMNGLMGDGEGEEGSSGLGDMLSGLLGGEGGNFSLSSVLEPLLQKLSSLKNINVSEIVDALKAKFGGLLGGGSRSLEGEDGEGLDITSLLGGLLSSDGSENNGEGLDISSLLGGLLGGGSDEGEEVSEDDLTALLGLLLGGESGEEFDLDALIAEYMASPEYQDYLARREALKVYLNEEYGDTLEKGDEQIVIFSAVLNFDNDDPNTEFGYYALVNYRAEGTDLRLMNYAGNTELLTYEKQEDGTFKVAVAVTAEEGEGAEDSIRAMCESYGVTFDDYLEQMDVADFDDMYELWDFLNEHPEYERIEYQGQLLTAEELDKLMDEFIDSLSSAYSDAEE